ncbi:MAG: glycosyltransferase [Bacteroidota bacterium]
MRVLYCHTYYQYRGGEDLSFESEVQMLREGGVEVIPFVQHNAQIGAGVFDRVRAVGRAVYNRQARRDVEALIRKYKPDVMHCNNLFPQISQSIYAPARDLGVPIVQALRNYRTFCANACFYRAGAVCTACHTQRAAFASVRHGCYRDSRAASAVVTAMQLVQRTLQRMDEAVSVYFTPSEFARRVHIDGGYDAERVHVKPNFVHPDLGPGPGDSETFVFVGRLSTEKGIDTLMKAWDGLRVPLVIVGDGPLRPDVEAFAQAHPMVSYRGQVDLKEVVALLGDARCLVMPSQWYETFGRTIVEAFSRGTPVIASNLGAMAELVADEHNGLLFEAGNEAALRAAVGRIGHLAPARYASLRAAARQTFTQRFTRASNFERLLELYALALGSRASGAHPAGAHPAQHPWVGDGALVPTPSPEVR